MCLENRLAERYLKILTQQEYQPLIQAIADDFDKGHGNGLSDILLGFVPEQYENAEHKILIVGRETAGWRVNKDTNFAITQYDAQIIEKSMGKSKKWVFDNLEGSHSKDVQGRSFFNFVRSVGKKCGKHGILWANTFAVDYQKSLPTKKKNPENVKKLLPIIKQVSQALLQAQMDILQPDYILFVGGKSSLSARNAYFPTLKGDGKPLRPDLPIKYLEKFMFDGQEKPICYRTGYHPSYFRRDAQRAFKVLVEILPSQSKANFALD